MNNISETKCDILAYQVEDTDSGAQRKCFDGV